jgi:Tfp pilus assembly protein PilN
MTLKGSSVKIQGIAMDENAVANYYSNIDASPFFEEPKLTNLARSRGDTFSFGLDCIFINSPPEIVAASNPQPAAAGQ